MPGIAIIIPHYNDAERLERCLSALAQNDLSGCEVVVVDNGSTMIEPLAQVQARFADVGFVTEPEKGAAAARNRGVAETSAPCLMFIDADCVPAPDWVATGRAVAGRADLIGGRVEVFDETPPPRSGAEAFEAVFAFDFRHYIEVQGFSGTGNLVTRRDVFEDVGPVSRRRVGGSRLVVSRHREGVSPDLCRRAARRAPLAAGLARAQGEMAAHHAGDVRPDRRRRGARGSNGRSRG